MLITDVYTNFTIPWTYKKRELFVNIQIIHENENENDSYMKNDSYMIMLEPGNARHEIHMIGYDIDRSGVDATQLLMWFYDDTLGDLNADN